MRRRLTKSRALAVNEACASPAAKSSASPSRVPFSRTREPRRPLLCLSSAHFTCTNRPILVLDEATSALDTHNERLIQTRLRELVRPPLICLNCLPIRRTHRRQCTAVARPHELDHRAPPLDHRRRRPDLRSQGRTDRRARVAQRAPANRGRCLRRCVSQRRCRLFCPMCARRTLIDVFYGGTELWQKQIEGQDSTLPSAAPSGTQTPVPQAAAPAAAAPPTPADAVAEAPGPSGEVSAASAATADTIAARAGADEQPVPTPGPTAPAPGEKVPTVAVTGSTSNAEAAATGAPAKNAKGGRGKKRGGGKRK